MIRQAALSATILAALPLFGQHGGTTATNPKTRPDDIRAGAAMVLAALCAEGETTITDVRYIERGYDQLDEKLRSLGAKIDRQEITAP